MINSIGKISAIRMINREANCKDLSLLVSSAIPLVFKFIVSGTMKSALTA